MESGENKEIKSKRDVMLERLKVRYPDKDFSDEEAVYGQISDDYDEYDNDIEGLKQREATFLELFNKDPKFAQFMAEAANGADPWLVVIERLGIDGVMDLMNDPEKKAEYAAKNAEYVARVAKEKELEAEYEANKDESSALLDKVQEERGLSDEMRDEIIGTVMRIAQDAVMGKITIGTIDMVLNAISHDADVENARSEGVVAGRNAKIDEKLRTAKEGDGLPNGSASGSAPVQKKGGFSIFEEARSAM